MKTQLSQWRTAAAKHLLLGMAVSTWNYRPPSGDEVREVSALLRELIRDHADRRAAETTADGCAATAAFCCPGTTDACRA